MILQHHVIENVLVNYWDTFRGIFIKNKYLYPSENNN